MKVENKMLEFAMSYAAAWSSGDPDRVASFFADDGSLSINGGPVSVGRAAIAADARRFMIAFPDLAVSFDSLISTELGTEFHWTLTGTNTGPGGKGNRVRISGYEAWRMDAEGLVAESKGYFDADEYASQIE
jgi:hypothetical protein